MKKTIQQTYKPEQYPTLYHQRELWAQSSPLAGLTVLDATPVFRNTMAKYLALQAAGARLIVGISDVMPYDPNIVELLGREGIEVVHANQEQTQKIDLILDCAASFISWKAERGYVELTRSGIDAYTQANKAVYLADSGVIKRIETSLGTGESFFRALNHMGYSEFAGKRLVIYGSGKVGKGIEIYAKRYGMDISIITKDTHRSEFIDPFDTEMVNLTLSNADIVVTATGVKAVVERSCDIQALISSKALLANMGVEDEFGDSFPSARVLEGKKPINFILEEPTHLKYIDATMALHNYGAIYLNEHPDITGVVLPDKQTEDEFLSITTSKGLIGDELGDL